MVILRKRLSWFAAAWLFCQAAGFAAAPVTFGARSIVTSEDACDCPGTAPGQACPMHSQRATKDDSENTCRLRNACAPDDAALLTLVSGVGIAAQPTAVPVERMVVALDPVVSSTLVRTDLPDSPPPRA
jgi:hypothetical protein